jgi:hypothetical protein
LIIESISILISIKEYMKRHEENIKDVAPTERVSTMLRSQRRRDSMKTLGIPFHDSEMSLNMGTQSRENKIIRRAKVMKV